MKSFHLVSKYTSYFTWDEKQNAPFNQKIIIPHQFLLKKVHEVESQGIENIIEFLDDVVYKNCYE